MREGKTTKVTITVPRNLLAVADRLADQRSTSRSGLIAQLLRKAEEDELEAALKADTEWQEENLRIAMEFKPTVDRLMRAVEWNERPNG